MHPANKDLSETRRYLNTIRSVKKYIIAKEPLINRGELGTNSTLLLAYTETTVLRVIFPQNITFLQNHTIIEMLRFMWAH
jgi:hypothetical protein